MIKRPKHFTFCDYFINSWNTFSWLCVVVVRRKFMLIALGRDPYSFFLRVVSRAYLPMYNLGWVGKSAELYKLKKMVKKLRATWTVLISIYVLQVAMVGQFSMKARMCLRFPPYEAVALAKHLKGCKAPASCSPFFFPSKSMKRLLKKCQILTIGFTFSTTGLWMQCFTKNWAWDHFVENATLSKMASKLTISLQTEAACYSQLF